MLPWSAVNLVLVDLDCNRDCGVEVKECGLDGEIKEKSVYASGGK